MCYVIINFLIFGKQNLWHLVVMDWILKLSTVKHAWAGLYVHQDCISWLWIKKALYCSFIRLMTPGVFPALSKSCPKLMFLTFCAPFMFPSWLLSKVFYNFTKLALVVSSLIQSSLLNPFDTNNSVNQHLRDWKSCRPLLKYQAYSSFYTGTCTDTL